MSALAEVPVIGSVFADITEPLEAAAGRTAGITTAIARAGGTVTPELRKTLYDKFTDQEKRVRAEKKEVGKMSQSTEAVGEAMVDSKLGEVVEHLGNAVDIVKEWHPTMIALGALQKWLSR